EVHPVRPEIDVVAVRQVTAPEGLVLRGPALREAQDGARRQAGRLRAQERGQRLPEVPRRQPVQVEERQHALHARRPPHVRRQDHTRELLPDAVDDPPIVHPGRGEGHGADPRGHRTRARRAVAHDQGVAALVARRPEARHILRDLQVQRRRDHPPRTVARQVIQRRADRRRLIGRRLRRRGDNLQHGWRTFPPVATGALGLTAQLPQEGYVAFLAHPQLLTIALIRPTKHPTVVELRPKGIFSDHGTRLERLIDVLLASYPRMFY